MSLEMQIIVARFDTQNGAKDALKGVRFLARRWSEVALLSKSTKGKIRVRELNQPGLFEGTVGGAMGGARKGSFIPIVGTIAGAVTGAVVGGAASLRDGGFPNDWLRDLAESLEVDHSMCVMMIDSGAAEEVKGKLAGTGGQVAVHPVNSKRASDAAAEVGEAQVELSADDDETG